jgi:hypothetical protein
MHPARILVRAILLPGRNVEKRRRPAILAPLFYGAGFKVIRFYN